MVEMLLDSCVDSGGGGGCGDWLVRRSVWLVGCLFPSFIIVI